MSWRERVKAELQAERDWLVDELAEVDQAFAALERLTGEPSEPPKPRAAAKVPRPDDAPPPRQRDIILSTCREFRMATGKDKFTSADIAMRAQIRKEAVSACLSTLVEEGQYIEVVDRRAPSQGGNLFRFKGE